MAFDYYLSDSDSHERVQIPEWFDVTDLRQEQRLVGGLIDYFDIFTRSQVIDALNRFNAVGGTEQELHRQGLEHLKRSEAHQFKITAVYWTSGMDWDASKD